MQETEMVEKLAHLEERAKSNTKRIDELDKKVENIHEIATSVQLLASETKAMREDVNSMNVRLNNLEEKPGKNWDNLIKQIITRNCNCNFGLFFCKIWNVGGEKHECSNYIKCNSISNYNNSFYNIHSLANT